MAHVFAGLAAIELGRLAEAKQHYKTAIAAQPNDPLAWKVHCSSLCVCGLKPLASYYVLLYQGLASYYDKHPPSAQGEVEDALQSYQTLLPHIDRYMSTLISGGSRGVPKVPRTPLF